jgi:hypothetical protein
VFDVNLTVGGVQEKLKFSRDGPVLVLERSEHNHSCFYESGISKLRAVYKDAISSCQSFSHKGPTYVYVSIHQYLPLFKKWGI